MCKKCCVKHVLENDSTTVCKEKGHTNASKDTKAADRLAVQESAVTLEHEQVAVEEFATQDLAAISEPAQASSEELAVEECAVHQRLSNAP